ncbi:MAG: universal stress protein [Burkholderiales bacterium]|nr:universal stress protein [Burkholderiales bacterium]
MATDRNRPATTNHALGRARTDSRQDTWLLAADGSRGAENAARYVARTARAFGVDGVQLINARTPAFGAERGSAARQRATALADAERATASVRRILAFAGLRYRLEAPLGDDPAALIAAAADRAGVTEIVMGTRGASMMSSITLGSVAYKVLHMARQNVTLVPVRARGAGGGGRDPLTMLVAVDGSNTAIRAVQYAAHHAAANPGLRIVLLNVQPRIISGNVRRFASRAQIEAYAHEQADDAMRQAVRILDKAGVRHSQRVATGSVVETILEAAADCHCGRIVLGTRGYGSAKSLLLGSVAYGVVHHAEVPVTVVKQALSVPVLLPGPAERR